MFFFFLLSSNLILSKYLSRIIISVRVVNSHMIIWHLFLSMQDEIIKAEKREVWLISAQLLFINNREDQLNFDLAAIEAYWWKNPAGTSAGFTTLASGRCQHIKRACIHTPCHLNAFARQKEHTCLHKQTRTQWCCHCKNRSTHKLFICVEREMKSMFT